MATGRRDRFRGFDADEKANLALEEIDLLEEKFDSAVEVLSAGINGTKDELAGVRRVLVSILITIVTGMVIAFATWALNSLGS